MGQPPPAEAFDLKPGPELVMLSSVKVANLPKGHPIRVELLGKTGVFVSFTVSNIQDSVLSLTLEEGETLPSEFEALGAKVLLGVVNRQELHTVHGVVLGQIEGFYKVEIRGEFTVQQLRQYFRAPYGEKVTLRVLSSSRPELIKQREDAMALDLSAGGMQLNTRLPLQVEDVVHVEFAIGIDKEKSRSMVSFEGTIRRCVPTPKNTFTVGIQFKAPSMKEQDRVVAYLLRKQTALT